MTTDAEKLNIILSARDKELAAAIDRNTKRIARFAQAARKDLSDTSKRWDQVGKSANGASGGLSKVLNVSSSGRFVLQNTSAQIGDIAVQLEQGTAASRVMAQQLPQLLGGFGALGGTLGIVAPLLGTVAAVGIPLAAMLMMVGGNSEEAAEKVATFEEKLAAAEAAMARADAAAAAAGAGGLDAMAERYGEVSEKVRDLADALAEIEERAAQVAIGQVLDDALGENFQAEIQGLFGTVGAAIANAGTEEAKAEAEAIKALIQDTKAEIALFEATSQAIPGYLTAQLAELNSELAAVEGRVADIGALAGELVVGPDTLAAIDDMRARLEEARAAGDFLGMANAISDLRAALQAAGGDVDQSVIDKLVQAEDQSRLFANQLGQAGDIALEVGEAAGGIAPALSPAVSEAVRLAHFLGVSLATAQRIAAFGPQGVPGAAQGGRGGDPRQYGGSAYDWQTREATEFLDNWKPPKAPRAARSGGGRSGRTSAAKKTTPAEVRTYERALDRLEDAFSTNSNVASAYREALEGLRTEYDAGNISGEDFGKSVDRVADAFTEASRRAQSLRDTAARTFSDILTGATSARDGLSGLFSNLAGQFGQAAFGGLFKSSGIFDGLGQLLSFDGGGWTGSGPRSGGLDGKGGYLAMVHPQESVIDHTKGRSSAPASAASGGDVNINVNVSGARGNAEISDMVQKGVTAGLRQYDAAVLPRRIRQVSNDPRKVGG